MITIFKNIYDKDSPVYRDEKVIFQLIRNGKYKDRIHQIRTTTDKANKSRFKNDLPSVCFSGEFTKRFDKDIKKHSGLVVLDFDHVPNLTELKETICKDKYTYASFISPSGDGLKVVVKIPPVIEDHEAHYYALIKKYPNLDSTSKNISRVCFVSYDPDIYINEQSEVFTQKGKLEIKKTEVRVREAQTTDYKKIQVAADIIRNAIDGEKHHALIKAARLAGGFIAGGLVEEYEAIRILESEINGKNITDFKGACKTIQDGIEYGKREPISEQNHKERIETIIKTDIIIEDEPAKDVIYLDDVWEKILYSFENGSSRGKTTHFSEIDKCFRMKTGEITLFHGIGNHGKSTMAYQLAMVKSVKDGLKWGVFSPENMPEEEFYKDLIHTYIGKSTEKHHHNQMSVEELQRGARFVKEHFYLIYPKNDAPTPDYMNNRFRELIIKHNITGCIIDPYNQLDNDMSKSGGRDDVYLSHFLTNCKRFAIEHDIYFWIITHPKGGLQKNGQNYECPNVYDLAGGAMWNNKMDNILAVHRPNYYTDKEDTKVLFVSQKIKKQKLNGIPGSTLLTFDRYTNRFYQEGDYNPLEPVKEPEKQVINPNQFIEPDRDIWENELWQQRDDAPF